MKTLHLNLKQKWFEMILSGEKPEEYRDLTPYWINRLIDFSGCPKETPDCTKNFPEDILYDIKNGHDPYEVMKAYYSKFKSFDSVTFSNGYAKNRPQFTIELKGIEIKEGNTEWGAEPGKEYFTLKLGEFLSDPLWIEILQKQYAKESKTNSKNNRKTL